LTFRGDTLELDPMFAAQCHAIYHTRLGNWTTLDTTYYSRSNPTIDGKRRDSGGHPRGHHARHAVQ